METILATLSKMIAECNDIAELKEMDHLIHPIHEEITQKCIKLYQQERDTSARITRDKHQHRLDIVRAKYPELNLASTLEEATASTSENLKKMFHLVKTLLINDGCLDYLKPLETLHQIHGGCTFSV